MPVNAGQIEALALQALENYIAAHPEILQQVIDQVVQLAMKRLLAAVQTEVAKQATSA